MPADPARESLVEALKGREREPFRRARRAIEQFDQQAWKGLVHTLQGRARLLQRNSLAAQCLVLERYQELRRLHVRAMRTQEPKPWHELRVSLKRFRYAVESLLPERATSWGDGLRHMQDLLGEIHDLDILASLIARESAGVAVQAADSVRQGIETRRQACLTQYLQRAQGRTGLLREWRAGLPRGTRIAMAATARLRATARAMDSHPSRTADVMQLAIQLFDALVATGVVSFDGDNARVILNAAAQLHAIGSRDHQTPPQKAARDILRALPAPPGWTREDWELLSFVVRYHRGAEPKNTHRRFARLPEKRQTLVRGLAGVLRLARALRRSGVKTRPRIRADNSALGIRLRVVGAADTRANAARLAASKHLLDGYLHRPLIIESSIGIASVAE
jgi:exopolyphosphatase/guanosine-5'-triphosphate,3'-diphosphate pyrophosphatase